MPVYCYEDKDGTAHEEVFPWGKAPKTLTVDGVKFFRCYAAERKGVPATAGWPMECVASGVNAAQAGELRDHLASKGVPTEISRDGNPIYRDAKHRKKALKARGMFDRQSFL
jgi:hypothetical protein